MDDPDTLFDTGTNQNESTAAIKCAPRTNRDEYGRLYWNWVSPHEWEKGWKDTPEGKKFANQNPSKT